MKNKNEGALLIVLVTLVLTACGMFLFAAEWLAGQYG